MVEGEGTKLAPDNTRLDRNCGIPDYHARAGLYFRRKSGKSTGDYFVAGREVSWWLAGTSMVATTFAADTPLAVCGLVYTQGVAGNWLWWSFCQAG